MSEETNIHKYKSGLQLSHELWMLSLKQYLLDLKTIQDSMVKLPGSTHPFIRPPEIMRWF